MLRTKRIVIERPWFMCSGLFVHYLLPVILTSGLFYLCVSRPDVGAKRKFVDADVLLLLQPSL